MGVADHLKHMQLSFWAMSLKGTKSCGTQETFVRRFVRPPRLSGLKSAISGLKSALASLKSVLSGLKYAHSDSRPERADIRPERGWGDRQMDVRRSPVFFIVNELFLLLVLLSFIVSI